MTENVSQVTQDFLVPLGQPETSMASNTTLCLPLEVLLPLSPVGCAQLAPWPMVGPGMLWPASTLGASVWTKGTRWYLKTQRYQEPQSPKGVTAWLFPPLAAWWVRGMLHPWFGESWGLDSGKHYISSSFPPIHSFSEWGVGCHNQRLLLPNCSETRRESYGVTVFFAPIILALLSNATALSGEGTSSGQPPTQGQVVPHPKAGSPKMWLSPGFL